MPSTVGRARRRRRAVGAREHLEAQPDQLPLLGGIELSVQVVADGAVDCAEVRVDKHREVSAREVIDRQGEEQQAEEQDRSTQRLSWSSFFVRRKVRLGITPILHLIRPSACESEDGELNLF